MQIAIFNQSSLISDADAATMTQAIATQVRQDAAPIWDRAPATVQFYTDATAIPAAAHVITITDTIQDEPARVLGFHNEDPGGRIWGTVAAQPELTNGGQVSTGDWSVSSVLSHEVLEMFVDPNCNLWSNDGHGSIYTFEVCDPVEAPTYTVNGVSVSNFVTPAWFDPLAKGVEFDKLGLLTAPFAILRGGYVVYARAGHEQQKFGDDFPPWRREMKQQSPHSRTRQFLDQAGAFLAR